MTISFKVSDATKEKMIEHFQDLKRDKTPQYAIFQADEEDTVVTLYESGKVVFQGVSADIDAEFWKETEKILTGSFPEEKEKKKRKNLKIIQITISLVQLVLMKLVLVITLDLL